MADRAACGFELCRAGEVGDGGGREDAVADGQEIEALRLFRLPVGPEGDGSAPVCALCRVSDGGGEADQGVQAKVIGIGVQIGLHLLA
jgi:hypothetical protein